MNDFQALYASICANPDEDTPRLMLADYLDELGDAASAFRADFIRTHCQFARAEPGSPEWRELNTRWLSLHSKGMKQHEKEKLPWVAHLKGRVKAWSFERGFVGHLTLFSKRFVTEGNKYFEQDPIRSVKFVKLTSTQGTVKPHELFACPHLARAAKLDFDGSGLTDSSLTQFIASPHVKNLRSLGLGGQHRFSTTTLPKVLKALPQLAELSLVGNLDFDDKLASSLGSSANFAQIKTLNIANTPVTVVGIAAIAQSKHAATLEALHISPVSQLLEYEDSEDYQDSPAPRAQGIAIAEALAASSHLGALRELSLMSVNIGDTGLKALVAAEKRFPSLRQLDLSLCGITMEGAQLLADSALGGRLRMLNFQFNANLARGKAKLQDMFPNAYIVPPYWFNDE
jgi:uncharacterized protein (TIGR02996 family)